MADQEVQNGGAEKVATEAKSVALDLHAVLGVEAPKADDAVQFYKAVFGAVEVERGANAKRKADLERPLIHVLLQFGSCKVLVVDRLEDELKAHQNSTGLALVCEGDIEAVMKKVVAAGGITESGGVTEDHAFPGKQYSGKVKDPFGIVWTIVGNKTITAASETGPENTTAAEIEANNTTDA
ncbi:putative glyoxalase/Bleomycin resistance protein/Dihydroxybiphenyl dioxygenase [Rosa chinensis]|uniref:Putative glyoxalase/Bleomycin resistance protein/Dihydroxybiphenyl dioxygenase n=1 Tax=Rosa chinensis TaxID=74649 RepID=A0A2P6PTV4_ROSCH|nr:uncharacterized protein At5g48480 [Rosa chinensis]PRQ25359.1 putative glyoxalase/Bleomycin resistance protein/Dihydroxybiphenyl dioxygenase [Rosa chinensis]